MGAEAARRLHADGFKIVILSSSGKGEALAAKLGGIGVTSSNQSADDLQKLVDGALERWGRIDVFIWEPGRWRTVIGVISTAFATTALSGRAPVRPRRRSRTSAQQEDAVPIASRHAFAPLVKPLAAVRLWTTGRTSP
jgi:NAD(P)-dependent dehydrogenase (short-subunit alcohol dehydrogenase family)